jgi:hypothetical protein
MDRSDYADRETINFNEGRKAVQFEIQRSLRQSLRLQSFESGRSMGDIAVEALTTRSMIAKAWAALRKIA